MKITTIKISSDTKNRLIKLQIHKRETYDDIIQKMLSLLNLLKANPYQAKARLEEIEKFRSLKNNINE